MITIANYFMGRDVAFPGEVTPQMRDNAADMVARANMLLEHFGQVRSVNSGWRPRDLNANTPGAAHNSPHIMCNAVDLEDRDGELDKFCMANPDLLTLIGLWMEHPEATPHWCHVQRVPPLSGKRVFIPNASIALRLAAQRKI